MQKTDDEDAPETRQRNEIASLQAIFMCDFKSVNVPSPNEAWFPPEFILLLKPQKGLSTNDEVHVTVDLHVTFCRNYPQISPKFVLENAHGISTKDVDNLLVELIQLCVGRIGEEVIFLLSDHVRVFLAERNQKPRFRSFHEEMLAAQKHEIEKFALEEKSRQVKEDEEQLMAFREEIQRKQPALLSELRRSKALDVSHHPLLEIDFAKNLHNNQNTNDSDVHVDENVKSSCKHSKIKGVSFGNKDSGRMYYCGPCMGACHENRFVCAAVDVNLKESAAITILKIPCLNLESRRKQISLIEQEFRLLQKVHHPNLINYLAFKWDVVENEESIRLFLAEQLVSGVSLNFYVNRNLPVNVDVLRHISSGVLRALEALHKANLVHKNLRHSCVYIDSTGIVRVGDYTLESRILEVLSIKDERPTMTMYPSAPGRGGKRGDIHRAGILIWTLFQGNVVHRWDNLKLPSAMPILLRDFINKCIGSDDGNRVNIEDLLSHTFLKTPLHREIQKHEESQDEDEPRQAAITYAVPAMNSNGHPAFPSRLLSEFETLQFLGSGGFGDVLKVKNKLDGNVYAIKRILLDTKSRQLNKKITREVKLLSRLNHENIVRYYNSWLETAQADSPTSRKNPRLSEVDVKENLASDHSDSDSDSSSLSAKGPWFTKPVDSNSSGGIEFEEDSDALENSSSDESTKEIDTVDSPTSSSLLPTSLQFMYIQMEYCEKSTLRTAIDSELFRDKIRIMRLFREIVEGLAYIHQQGIIHRDLKPVNIFLDSEDHVKIGDFGLATSSPLTGTIVDVVDGGFHGTVSTEKSSELVSSSGQFGQIGTALYVAPELKCVNGSAGKAAYNEKVDIYSLGIIFFEMCHPALTTGMERIKVLSALRLPEIVLPQSDQLTTKEVQIIEWLLNHNPIARPSSTELLQSPALPPPQLEDAELQEMIRHTLSNTQSKTYKHLVASCFQQKMTPTEEIFFDYDTITVASAGLQQSGWFCQTLQEIFIKHCQRRGAIHFKTPTLAPKVQEQSRLQVLTQVQLMNHAGGIITLPVDLHTPFARFIARSSISWMKRYAVDVVYNERKLMGMHPKSSPELAFDIVTPLPASVLTDAEVLSTLSDVFYDFRLRLNRPVILQLSHNLLLKAVLVHCGIPEEKRVVLCQILETLSKSEGQLQSRTSKLAIPRQSMDMLMSLLLLEGSLSKITSSLTSLLSRKGEAASLAKQAIHELDAICTCAEHMGQKSTISIRLNIALHSYATHSGFVFRFVCQSRAKRSNIIEVLASGGRYDALVTTFHKAHIVRRKGEEEAYQRAIVGGSIHVDKVVSILKDMGNSEEQVLVSAVICTLGYRPQIKEQALIVRDLWNNGVRATVLDHCQSLEEVQEWCKEKNVPYIVILKDSEAGSARLKTWEKDRYTERKMSLAEIVETLTSNAETTSDLTENSTGCGRQELTNRSNSISESSCNPLAGSSGSSGVSGSPMVNLHIVVEEKLPLHARRRYEKQILKNLQITLQNFNSRAQVDVVAIEATSGVIQSLLIALYVDPSDIKAVEQAIGAVVDKHRRQRKYLQRIYEQLFQLRNDKHATVPITIIYGLHDNSHRVLM